jgi:general stress protein YciG
MTNKRGPTAGTEEARQGGNMVKAKYGSEFYRQIGKKGGQAVKARQGPDFYAEIGKRGGESTKRSQGPDFYSRIGRIGGTTAKGARKGRQAASPASAPERTPQ